MRFLKKLIRKLVRWADQTEENMCEAPSPTKVRASPRDMGDPISFNMYNAVGGKVLQLSTYDSSTGNSRSTLYIITNDMSLGTELEHIIVREYLGR